MRRTHHLYRALVLGGCLTLFFAASPRASDEPLKPGFALGGIQSGLNRSPDVYVAALLEVVGAPQCSDPTISSTCVADTRLVDVFASRGGEFKSGGLVAFSGAGPVGSRYLAFLVPIDGRAAVYGATFLSVQTSDDERKTFVADLRKAGL